MAIDANGAELTDLYAASTGVDVKDEAPNSPAPPNPPATSFELHIKGVAGYVLGSGNGPYTLTITCIDDVTAAPTPAMSIGPLPQEFGKSADGWAAAGPAGNYVNEQVFAIPVPGGVRGDVFHYEARLVNPSGNIISFIRSDPFILV